MRKNPSENDSDSPDSEPVSLDPHVSCLCYTEHAYFWLTRNSEPYHGSNRGPYAEKNGQNVARLLVSLSANACSMRRALTPSRSEAHLDVRFLEALQPVWS